MFDSSLDRSRLYFIVLQLLRIMRDWILESLGDVKVLEQNWKAMRQRRSDEIEQTTSPDGLDKCESGIDRNWKILIKHLEHRGGMLLHRIDQQTSQIISLRDGVRA
jgi:hypothetical protein